MCQKDGNGWVLLCFLRCTYIIRSFKLERQEIFPRPQIGGRATATARRTCRCRAGRPQAAATSPCPPTPASSTAASSSTGSSIRFAPWTTNWTTLNLNRKNFTFFCQNMSVYDLGLDRQTLICVRILKYYADPSGLGPDPKPGTVRTEGS